MSRETLSAKKKKDDDEIVPENAEVIHNHLDELLAAHDKAVNNFVEKIDINDLNERLLSGDRMDAEEAREELLFDIPRYATEVVIEKVVNEKEILEDVLDSIMEDLDSELTPDEKERLPEELDFQGWLDDGIESVKKKLAEKLDEEFSDFEHQVDTDDDGNICVVRVVETGFPDDYEETSGEEFTDKEENKMEENYTKLLLVKKLSSELFKRGAIGEEEKIAKEAFFSTLDEKTLKERIKMVESIPLPEKKNSSRSKAWALKKTLAADRPPLVEVEEEINPAQMFL